LGKNKVDSAAPAMTKLRRSASSSKVFEDMVAQDTLGPLAGQR
jgi:hypothetical protein